MSDLYLKTESEAAMMAALDEAGLVDDGIVQVCGKADVYVIGTMYDTTDSENPVVITGFHANVRTEDEEIISILQALAVEVNSPSFVFA